MASTRYPLTLLFGLFILWLSCNNDLPLPELKLSVPATSNHLILSEKVDQSAMVDGVGAWIDEHVYALERSTENDLFLVKRSTLDFEIEGKLLLFEDLGRADSIGVSASCRIKGGPSNHLFLFFDFVLNLRDLLIQRILVVVDKNSMELLDMQSRDYTIFDMEITPQDTILLIETVQEGSQKTNSLEKLAMFNGKLETKQKIPLPSLDFLNGTAISLNMRGNTHYIQSTPGGDYYYLSSYDSLFQQNWWRNVEEAGLISLYDPISLELLPPYILATNREQIATFSMADGSLGSYFKFPEGITPTHAILWNDTLLVCGYASEKIPLTSVTLGYGVIIKAPVIDGIIQTPVIHTFGASDTFSTIRSIRLDGDELICAGRTEKFYAPSSNSIYATDLDHSYSYVWGFRVKVEDL